MSSDLLSAFSKNYLNDEPVPDDLAKSLTHNDEFFEITGIRLLSDADEQPWNDISYLSPQELEDPDIASNVRAMTETNRLIAFFAVSEDDRCYGFWRGPQGRSIADSPWTTRGNMKCCTPRRLLRDSLQTCVEAMICDHFLRRSA